MFELGDQGATDAELAARCIQLARVMVTQDADFGDIRRFPPAGTPGVVVIKVRRQDNRHLLAVLKRLAITLNTVDCTGHLVIVDDATIRIR